MTRPDYCPVAQAPCQAMCALSDVRCQIRDTQPAAPNDFELMKCWVEKPDGTIDGIASMRLVLSKYGTAAQRQWVGLTDEQINQYDYQYRDILYDAEKMLRENNA
jgi:hypothetical protein